MRSVAWSRGAAIASEIAQGLAGETRSTFLRDVAQRAMLPVRSAIRDFTAWRRGPLPTIESVPPIKFVGLFDAVAMVWISSPNDGKWGESITSNVEYFAHVIAGDRSMIGGVGHYFPTNPTIEAQRQEVMHLAHITHGGVGGVDSTESAQTAYDFIRNHATLAGVP